MDEAVITISYAADVIVVGMVASYLLICHTSYFEISWADPWTNYKLPVGFFKQRNKNAHAKS